MRAPDLDDVTIRDEENLWRRVPPGHWIAWDKNENRWRPSSAAFEDGSDGDPLSVFLEGDALARGLTPLDALHNHEPGFCLASVTAHLARELNQLLARDPMPEDPDWPCNPVHALVIGDKNRAKRRMAKAAQWIIEPDLPLGGPSANEESDSL